jgi:beta-lactamase regulating signal transducer with metallopeptidase domain
MSDWLEAFLNTFAAAVGLTALVWALLRWWPGLNAATRYAAWWVTLVMVLALPVAYLSLPPEPLPTAVNHFQLLEAPVPTPAMVERDAWTIDAWTIDAEPAIPWIALLWGLGTLLFLVRLAASYRWLRHLKKQSRVLEADIPASVGRRIRVLESADVASPVAVGFLHPAVIVPRTWGQQLDRRDLDHVIAHEFAHLIRRDDWMNLLGRAIEMVLWFHPLAWFILRRLAVERELACDAWVVHQTGDARAYAAMLLRLTELRAAGREPALATSMFGRKSNLRYRVEELLKTSLRFVPVVSRGRLSLMAAALIVLSVGALQLPAWVLLCSAPDPNRKLAAPAPAAGAVPREGFLAGLKAAGYGHLDVNEIIELRTHDVTPSYIAEVSALLGKIPARQLIELRTHGVLPRQIRQAKQFKSDLTIQQIVKLKHSGVLE